MIRVLLAFLIAAGSGLPVLALAAEVDAAGNPLPAATATAGPSARQTTVAARVSADPAPAEPAVAQPAAKAAPVSRSNWKKLLPGNIK
ncbi:MAG: hypothetical protein AB7V26_05405 [Lysobacterales bacterium]